MVYRVSVLGRPDAIVNRVWKAESLGARMIGLLGRTLLAEDEGLWIDPCKSVHTFGMKFPIDVIFLDRTLVVVRVVHAMSPGRMTRIAFSATSVIETAAGVARRHHLEPGDRLEAHAGIG